jgi:predicted transcriptional regulator
MANIKGRCEPAYNVVVRLGGVTSTAKLLGITQGAVSRWLATKDTYGTNGSIPRRYWDDILAFSQKHKIKIDLHDLSGIAR